MNHDTMLEALLPAFLQETSELLTEIDSQLTILEIAPHNKNILNVMFRNFHTIKGGASFLHALELANTEALVTLCRLTESLLDQLRNKEVRLASEMHALISAATAEVRIMLIDLERLVALQHPPRTLLQSLETALQSAQAPVPPRPVGITENNTRMG